MKTIIKVMLVSLLSIATYFVSAQSTVGSLRHVSKEVQKINNKAWLTHENLLTVQSHGSPAWVVSKRQQSITARIAIASGTGNMISEGYPIWTISKGVHRIKYTSGRKNNFKKGEDSEIVAFYEYN